MWNDSAFILCLNLEEQITNCAKFATLYSYWTFIYFNLFIFNFLNFYWLKVQFVSVNAIFALHPNMKRKRGFRWTDEMLLKLCSAFKEKGFKTLLGRNKRCTSWYICSCISQYNRGKSTQYRFIGLHNWRRSKWNYSTN